MERISFDNDAEKETVGLVANDAGEDAEEEAIAGFVRETVFVCGVREGDAEDGGGGSRSL